MKDFSRSTRVLATGVPARQTAARLFLRRLADAGVRVAYGIPGGTISPVFDAIADVDGLEYVATRHEATAAFAAMGHARVTGAPALVLTTSGPGLTNALTGIVSAHAEDLPLIVVSGEVPVAASGRGALQDGTSEGFCAREMLSPVTRWAGTVTSACRAEAVAVRALEAALDERRPGPVFVSFPLDVAAAPAARALLVPPRPRPTPLPDEAACQAVAGALADAERPLFVLGRGARHASPWLVELAERVGARVVVTGHAKGCFPESHPLYIGIVGLGQHPSVDEFLQRPPDVTLVVGSRLNDLATNGWAVPLVGTRHTFQIDREPLLVGRNARLTLGIVGDAANAVESVLRALPADVAREALPVRARRVLEPDFGDAASSLLDPRHVLAALQSAFPDAIWCSDIGEHLAFALHYLEVDGPERFHDFLGFGSMGSGIGAAIGIQHARPRSRVVCLAGDGGFSMLLGEVLTCVERRLPIVFVVMNDGRWNMVEHGFSAVYGRSPSGLISARADLAAAATALGAVGVVVDGPAVLEAERLTALLEDERPTVLDVRVDPRASLTRSTRSASLRHFTAEVHDG